MVEEKQIAPHIPVLDRSKRENGTFSREDFRYNEDTDIYAEEFCKELAASWQVVPIA